jgi:hypothetical protein
MCAIRSTAHVKAKGARNRGINLSLSNEHLRFRGWAVVLGKFERAAMTSLAKKGIIFYNVPAFQVAFENVSL